MFSGSCFFLNAANVRCSVLNGENAGVPEDIVVDWSLRFPRSAMATGTSRKPSAVWTIVLCIMYVDTCVPECTFYKIVKSLTDGHPSYTTTPM